MKKLLTITLVICMLLGLMAMPAIAFADSTDSAADWMAKLPGEAIIGNLNIPGSHDSGMCWVQLTTDTFGSRTQEYTIEEQLEMGVRIFDIRLRYDEGVQLNLCHGPGLICCDAYESPLLEIGGELTFETALNWACDFLDAHQGETVIYTIQQESDATPESKQLNYDASLQYWLEQYADRLLIVTRDEMKNLTLAEAREKIIIPTKDNIVNCGFGDFTSAGMNDWNSGIDRKWNAVNQFLNDAKDQNLTGKLDFRAAYTSCTGMDDGLLPIPGTWYIAEGMRDYLYSYNFVRGKHYGWVSMDRVNPKLARLIINTNRVHDAYYIGEIKAFCGDKKGSDPNDIEKTKQACLDAGYKVLDTNGIVNVNPLGYSMVLGYKQTLNEADAIRDIVGYYGYFESCPKGYKKVIVENSATNDLTRGSGSDTEYVYLAYTTNGDGPAVTDLEWVGSGGSVYTKYGGESLNVGKGTDYYFGLNFYVEGELYPAYTKYCEERTYYISDIRAFCGDSKDASNGNDWKEIETVARDQGYKLVSKQFMNVNPKGYNIAIGYKLTDNPYEAITNIVGVYGFNHDEPQGYSCVKLDNATFNYLSNGSGSDSEYTYLYYTRSRDFKPITELEIIEGEGNVLVAGSDQSFNFEAGLAEKVGLNITRNEAFDDSARGIASVFGVGALNIILSVVIVILLVVIFILIKKLKAKG
ncbi:MAG: phosphatidylinositol-specific phospholipase C domain-containing protein [Bacillota bacterium]|nr:phosphatidylinositol-specific phospholipase C domain-containing protein [Bacillota bacterium]